MEMWFSDIHTDGVKLSIRIEEQRRVRCRGSMSLSRKISERSW